jgi:hypothetical protein
VNTMSSRAKQPSRGWSHSRADKITAAGVREAREAVQRAYLKTEAEKAVTARLCHETIDKIMANRWQILPSRQQLFGVKNGTWRWKSFQHSDQPAMDFKAIEGTSSDHHENVAGWRNATAPVGRPRGSGATRSEGRAARLRRKRRFDGTPQSAGIGAIDWGMVGLSYVDNVKAPVLAERFNLTPVNVRQRLSRARRAAKAEGHELPK